MKFLLLQVRKPDDPMREHEAECFARELGCAKRAISVLDLITQAPDRARLAQADIVLLGGSGDFSVAENHPWLSNAFEVLREIHDQSIPTFASCWGFQAFARALGGEVVTDRSRAELGTIRLRLTDAGKKDTLFAPLGDTFAAQAGHQDIVEKLPPDAVLLASTSKVENQAFTFRGRPIYCTQFHPELGKNDLLVRLENYPQYVQSIAGLTPENFERSCYETPGTSQLLKRFVGLIGQQLNWAER